MAGLLALSVLFGCDTASMRALTAPSEGELSGVVRELSYSLERNSCAGCPTSWEPIACNFADRLKEPDAGLAAATCTIAGPMLGDHLPPPALLREARSVVEESIGVLQQRRARRTDMALQLFAYGADLRRIGSLEAWRLGVSAQTAAVAALVESSPSSTWPADLLALEEAAPAPRRLLGLAIIDTLNRNPEKTWQVRAGLGEAADLNTAFLRAAPEDGLVLLGQAEVALLGARAGLPPIDLKAALAEAEELRVATRMAAFNAALGARRTCPSSLAELGLPGTETWRLDPASCRALPPDGQP